jgi:hypothetical protein
LKWKIVAGAVAVLTVGGTGGAVAGVGTHHASGHSTAGRSSTVFRAGRFGGFGFFGGGLSAAATYLGISTADLRSQLKSGKTLAAIANATSGKSAAGLIQALVNAAKTKLDAAVSAGKLTQAQEQTFLSKLTPAITALVNGTGSKGKHLFPGRRRPPGK